MNKATLALLALAATPALGQIVYINSPDVINATPSLTQPNNNNTLMLYRVFGPGDDLIMGNGLQSYTSPGITAGASDGVNAGGNLTLLNREISYQIHNTGTGGLTFFAQYTVVGVPRSYSVSWGNDANYNIIPSGFTGAGNTISVANTSQSATLNQYLPAGGVTTPTFAYNSLAVTFINRGATPAGSTIAWNSTVFQGSGLTVNGTGFNSGTVNGGTLPSGNAQYVFSQSNLSAFDWTLTGKVTIGGTYAGDPIFMNVSPINANFTVVPEPAEYMAAVGGVALFGGLLLRRRRAQA